MDNLKKSRLNGMVLRNLRNDSVYDAVMHDLVSIGVISKEVYVALTGRVWADVPLTKEVEEALSK